MALKEAVTRFLLLSSYHHGIELPARGLSVTGSRFLTTPISFKQMKLLDIKFQVYSGFFPNLADLGNFSHMDTHTGNQPKKKGLEPPL
jgi:hypothetical protein